LGLQAFWILFVLGASVTTLIGARSYWVSAGVQPVLAGAAGYELGIGVLALAIQASLVWSEEKSAGREGTDLILSTPLSAATIVNGKWRGVFRYMAPVAVFPVISSLIVLGDAPALPAYSPEKLSSQGALAAVLLVVCQVLLYSAAFVSLGILLATRCAKPSHAVFYIVGIYLAVALFVPTIVELLLLHANRPLAVGLAIASPIAAPIMVIMTRFPGPYFGPAQLDFPYAALWLLVAAGVAWVCYRWTVHQFDRRMGRIPAAGRRSGSAIARVPVAVESRLLAVGRQSARE
jgi:ABC-type transport system involved in multi-copper enzyme maturation permease subunit